MTPTTFDDFGRTVQDRVNRWRVAVEAALEARDQKRSRGTGESQDAQDGAWWSTRPSPNPGDQSLFSR